MNELQQKPQLHNVSGSDFRVREYDGNFEIQRKNVTKITTGMLWWKKTKEETDWEFVDNCGCCLQSTYGRFSFNNYDQKIKPFKNLLPSFKNFISQMPNSGLA